MRAIIYPSDVVFYSIWAIVKWFMDPVTREKVQPMMYLSGVEQYIDRQYIPKSMVRTIHHPSAYCTQLGYLIYACLSATETLTLLQCCLYCTTLTLYSWCVYYTDNTVLSYYCNWTIGRRRRVRVQPRRLRRPLLRGGAGCRQGGCCQERLCLNPYCHSAAAAVLSVRTQFCYSTYSVVEGRICWMCGCEADIYSGTGRDRA